MASTAKHTPGPWTAVHLDIEGDGVTIARVLDQSAGDDHEANARLIAAAPQLLEALRLVAAASYHIETANMPRWLDAVEDAIRVATES